MSSSTSATSSHPAPASPWKPFPLNALPPLLAEFVAEVSASKVVDLSMAAMPLLAALAGAIGGSRRVLIKPDWPEPCILWTAIVAPSGSGKTPAAAPVLEVVRQRDAEAVERNIQLNDAYRIDLADYDRAIKKRKPDQPPIDKPLRPPLLRYHLQDVTPEQLLMVLADNPRGALLVRDELPGLFGGFGKYSDGKGASERAKYLSIWSADRLSDDRKVSDSAYVRSPHLSIFGGVQPDLLFRAVSSDDCAAGLPARFLFAWPPEQSRRWSDESVPYSLQVDVSEAFDRLYGLKFSGQESPCGQYVHSAAVDVPLAADAQSQSKAWHDGVHAPLVDDAHGALRAAFSKLPAYCGRLALVLQLSCWATNETAEASEVEADSVKHAITLVEWFRGEASRVYGLRAETDDERELRQLIDWIARKGGVVTARDLQATLRSYRESGAAEAALAELVKQGRVERVTLNTRGRPRTEFRMVRAETATEVSENRVL